MPCSSPSFPSREMILHSCRTPSPGTKNLRNQHFSMDYFTFLPLFCKAVLLVCVGFCEFYLFFSCRIITHAVGNLRLCCSYASSSAGFEPTQRNALMMGNLRLHCSHASSSAGFEPTQRNAARSACLAERRVRRLADAGSRTCTPEPFHRFKARLAERRVHRLADAGCPEYIIPS